MKMTLQHQGAPRTARRIVAQCCQDAATGPECCDTAVLLTSELVTNALLHGRGQVRLSVHGDSVLMRVEVGDEHPGRPRSPRPDDDAESGRGMLIVAKLASDWGVLDDDRGKTVWFEVACQP